MKYPFKLIVSAGAAFIPALFVLPKGILAAYSPGTGDPSERILGVIFLALGISLIVIVVLLLLSAKNHKDR